MRKLTRYEVGLRHFFGKRYMWLLSEEGRLGLHKVDDKGDEDSVEQLKRLAELQEEQSA